MVKPPIPLRDGFKVAATAACIFSTPAYCYVLKLHILTLIRLPPFAKRMSRISDYGEALMDSEIFDGAAWYQRSPDFEHFQ